MSSKIERAKQLASSKTTVESKNVKVQGLEEFIKDLHAMAVASQKSQDAMTKSINQLSQVIVMTAEEGPDMESLLEAVKGLKEGMEAKSAVAPDYVIKFDRDRNGLMKSGIQLNTVKRTLN